MKVGERFHLRLARLEILRAQAASVPALAKNARTGHPSGVVGQTMKPEKGWATGPEPRAGLAGSVLRLRSVLRQETGGEIALYAS